MHGVRSTLVADLLPDLLRAFSFKIRRSEVSKAGRSGAEFVRSTVEGSGGWTGRATGATGEGDLWDVANRYGWAEQALRIRPPGGRSDDAGHRLQESG